MRFCFLCPSVALGGKNTPRCYMKITMLVFLPRDARAERGDATVSRLSVCLSVCPSVRDDQVPCSNTLEFFENNFTAE